MLPARPTLRCLRDDLKLSIPPAIIPLDEIDHSLIAKAVEQFADPAGSRERIRAVDDQILHKVKVQRWRGAVWIEENQPWVIAAGWREEGSPDDFYQALANAAAAHRARYNSAHTPPLPTHTHIIEWLPSAEDHDRYGAEAATRLVRQLRTTVKRLIRGSLLDGHEHADTIAGARLGIEVRADEGHETYVAIRIIGAIPNNLVTAVLRVVPGCDVEGWYPEVSTPSRRAAPNEQIWSNLMDPTAAAELLAGNGH